MVLYPDVLCSPAAFCQWMFTEAVEGFFLLDVLLGRGILPGHFSSFKQISDHMQENN